MKLKIYFLLIALATFNLGLFAQAQKKASDLIQWNEKTHDFGTPEQNSKTEFNFEFTNISDAPIKLSSVKASCGCTTPKWTREEVAPGQKGTIAVSYNSSRVGPFNKSVRVWVDSLPDPDLIYIKGDVKGAAPVFPQAEGNVVGGNGTVPPPAVTPEPPKVNEEALLAKYKVPRGAFRFEQVQQNLLNVSSEEVKTLEFPFYNASDMTITFNTQKMDDQPYLKVEYPDVKVAPKTESKIKMTFDGTKYTGDDGYFSQRVQVFTDEPGQDNVKQLTVSGTFKRVYSQAELDNSPKIEFDVTSVDGGKIIEGEKFVYDFKFRNTGKSPLEINSAKASCGCTATAPKDEKVEPGQESYITATFDSHGRLGKQSKTVTVKSNDLNKPNVTLKFTVEVVKDPFHAGGMMGTGN
ncbi:MAG: DUF1573 domain-containing protein [Bacteroidia bacterium]|nr:DUF1573 domain-containing protein [Bacteroidia bacterium]